MQLIKAGWITFDDAPNVKSNPFPNHAASSGGVNVVGVEGKKEKSFEGFYGKTVWYVGTIWIFI